MGIHREYIADNHIDHGMLRSFAGLCGMGAMNINEFVTILGVYCDRKALMVKYNTATFTDALPQSTDTPTTARAQDQSIQELTAAL